MPYPHDPPLAKHDLLCPPMNSGTTLNDEIGFPTTAALFHALKDVPTSSHHTKRIAVYSYMDAPKQPLSRELLIIGVAEISLSVVRRLVGDDELLPDCLHRCTVAVKRADGTYANKLPEKDIHNSHSFVKLLRKLQKESCVAILGQDKYNRFGILKPTDDMSLDGDDYEGQDFACLCYVGDVDAVKEYLTQGMDTSSSSSEAAHAPSTPPSTPPPPDDEEPSYNAEDHGLWQPPGADNNNDDDPDATFSWQPPTGSGGGDESFDFGNPAEDTAGANTWAVDDSNGNKRKAEDMESSTFHTNAGAAAADAFYSGLTRSLDTRADSRLFHMRAFNGWVKATQIQELDPKTKLPGKRTMNGPLRILDLACGKGGDLGKWTMHSRGIANYVGIDVARGSLKDAALRVRKMGHKLKRCTFTCADLGSDVPGRLKSRKQKHMQKLLSWSLQGESNSQGDPEFKMVRGGGISRDDKFDVVSIQFAIHYMMQTKKRARRFFQTVSELLETGGNLVATTIDARVVIGHLMNLGLELRFDDDEAKQQEVLISVGGGACQIRFEPEVAAQIFADDTRDIDGGDDEHLFGLEYTFTLVEGSDHAKGVGDAVNLPEWLIPIPALSALANEAGLELEYAQNFHEFFAARKDPSAYSAAHNSMYSMKVLNRNGSISAEEWEISRLYMAVSFKKVRESTVTLDDSDIEQGDDDEEEEEEEKADEIDPAVKAKLLPMAMMKAKKMAGNDEWQHLSSEEKSRLIDIEVRNMISKT